MELLLIVFAFFTSTFTAITGSGGGLLLIALMPGLVPASAIVPIHALVQLASNASRCAFSLRNIRMEYVWGFLLGSTIGAVMGQQFIQLLNLNYITLIIAGFILLNVWAPALFNFLNRVKHEFFVLGLFQTSFGCIGATTGPMTIPSLNRLKIQRDSIVVTAAAQMAITHLFKVIVFGLVGFNIMLWWKLVAAMIIAATLGSWAGTLLRTKVNENIFHILLKYSLTLLAVRMIYITDISTLL